MSTSLKNRCLSPSHSHQLYPATFTTTFYQPYTTINTTTTTTTSYIQQTKIYKLISILLTPISWLIHIIRTLITTCLLICIVLEALIRKIIDAWTWVRKGLYDYGFCTHHKSICRISTQPRVYVSSMGVSDTMIECDVLCADRVLIDVPCLCVVLDCILIYRLCVMLSFILLLCVCCCVCVCIHSHFFIHVMYILLQSSHVSNNFGYYVQHHYQHIIYMIISC